MAYADYDFYTTSYFGNVVPETDFPRMAERASDFVDNMTFDRLMDGMPNNERYQKRIKRAVCSLTDLMYQLELAEKNAISVSVFSSKSETTGAEEVEKCTALLDKEGFLYLDCDGKALLDEEGYVHLVGTGSTFSLDEEEYIQLNEKKVSDQTQIVYHSSDEIVLSRSSGSESISYANPQQKAASAKEWSAVYAAAGDAKKTNDLLLKTALPLLMGVRTDEGIPILYAGFQG
ncbi:hypothetical protein [Blautia sp. MSJ-19]|uniref:hypothetical protein n=1 Tax=Blautia sp. MSJ-19 TaxID=2841517 RepID=UPI001C0F036C|nr:hypothetical protein [Blautia sp. MSJ-19]MBU5481729.1 hypothetical protein [Blautia sp. MSJ-19]